MIFLLQCALNPPVSLSAHLLPGLVPASLLLLLFPSHLFSSIATREICLKTVVCSPTRHLSMGSHWFQNNRSDMIWPPLTPHPSPQAHPIHCLSSSHTGFTLPSQRCHTSSQPRTFAPAPPFSQACSSVLLPISSYSFFDLILSGKSFLIPSLGQASILYVLNTTCNFISEHFSQLTFKQVFR